MDVFAIANHLLNFALPALFVAVLLATAGWALSIRSVAAERRGRAWWLSVWVNTAAGIAVLGGGLVVFGHDGKMATYAVLALVCGSCQWVLSRGWRG